ncbi:3-deoxy-D-arabino-heptulosonate 7-phosphate synthase [Puniceicoccus vermicola]|uniref:3-deoxy-D-arabino-heptulosonate 7-phosphate synthase n=1 Tax=Puniceicoccus vermicola TaxID=388746 RepID=A0A7X1E401_9BACT|nr:3-deoxy-D-arabino-heptulosonate 7-phosphate synthase [Puniceicoccus vermicola]MBC2601519.1 3-deoxy-D-arabino-heptulosonate 7-phosphate synthase [Puniceicoccus vermicola]
MIIPKESRLSPEQLREVTGIVEEFGCRIQEIVGAHRNIYAILGDERHELMFNRLIGLSYVARVDHIESSYRLLDKSSELANQRLVLGGVPIGEEPLFIAGPCTVNPQNPQLTLETADAVKSAGAQLLRGGVWKPRTMPYSYQGDHNALEILIEAREKTGLPLVVEVMDEEQLKIALEAEVDVLQIGTRNALNYSLLKAVGRLSAPTRSWILLKRGRHMADPDEFLSAAEYLAAEGNPRILLCPRGTMPKLDGYRNHPDESITPLLKERTWAPVVCDPSHSTGHASYVPAASLAAIAYGADGLGIEANVEPRKGIGDDPKQALDPAALEKTIRQCRALWNLIHEPTQD